MSQNLDGLLRLKHQFGSFFLKKKETIIIYGEYFNRKLQSTLAYPKGEEAQKKVNMFEMQP